MKKAILTCLTLFPLAAAGIGQAEAAINYAVSASAPHQAVKAEVVNRDPSQFTINLKKLANISVNKKAPTYVIYTGASLPSQCGDFSKDKLAYQKPDKYHRVFNLSQRPDILSALDKYGCVIIPNKPSLPPAKI